MATQKKAGRKAKPIDYPGVIARDKAYDINAFAAVFGENRAWVNSLLKPEYDDEGNVIREGLKAWRIDSKHTVILGADFLDLIAKNQEPWNDEWTPERFRKNPQQGKEG